MKLNHPALTVRDQSRPSRSYARYFAFDPSTARRYPDGVITDAWLLGPTRIRLGRRLGVIVGTIRNVNVYASVSRGGTIRRGDPVGRCAEAQASTNRATEAVKPCKKFFPPTGPISPEQLKPARGRPLSFSHTNEAS